MNESDISGIFSWILFIKRSFIYELQPKCAKRQVQ